MFLSSLLKHPETAHQLRNTRTGVIIASKVEGAFDSRTRRRGLLGRDHLPEGAALVIAPCNSIHTFFMRFPIDVVFVRKNGEVVKVSESVAAWRMRLALRAFATIELPAGTLGSHPPQRGDILAIEASVSRT